MPSSALLLQQSLYSQSEPLNRFLDSRPLFIEKFLAFGLQQQVARASVDEHAAASLHLDELLVDELLVALHHGDRIDAVLGGDVAHRGEGIAFVEEAVEDHIGDAIPKLPVDRLAVIPLTVHLI